MDDLVTQDVVAERLGVSRSWLAQRRYRGDGPPFIKLGRGVRYREADVSAWIEGQTRQITASS